MQEEKSNQQLIIVAGLSVLAILLGIGGGWLARGAGRAGSQGGGGVGAEENAEVVATVAENVSDIKAGDVFGSRNADDFQDSAQGYLQAGGIGGEGSHALLRAGGASQTVYLTSSVTDLDKFVGMDVKVWGETFKGQAAGWLMDVGRVEVLSLRGSEPD